LGATLRRWTLREENIRWAGWAGVIGYSLVALFNFVDMIFALIGWYWWPSFLPANVRYTEFIVYTAGCTVVLSLLAYVNWRVTRRHVPSMWVALFSSVLFSGFAASMLLGLNSYDVAGALRDPVLRVALYLWITPLALFGVLMSLLALVTTFRLRQWD